VIIGGILAMFHNKITFFEKWFHSVEQAHFPKSQKEAITKFYASRE
jgi:hypothetical protein